MWTTRLVSATPPPPCASLARQSPPPARLVSAKTPPRASFATPPPVRLVSANPPPPPPCASLNEARSLGQTMWDAQGWVPSVNWVDTSLD